VTKSGPLHNPDISNGTRKKIVGDGLGPSGFKRLSKAKVSPTGQLCPVCNQDFPPDGRSHIVRLDMGTHIQPRRIHYHCTPNAKVAK
jgi:hypothetical protein